MDKNRSKQISSYQKKLKIKFKSLNRLHKALLHSSYVNESQIENEDNEKLEFLGDSVLALIIIEYLVENFPLKDEGELSKIKSIIVSEETLSLIAKDMELGNYLLLGRGEELSGGKDRKAILADALEALIGAFYQDSGIKKVRKFIIRFFKPEIDKVISNQHHPDYKTKLQHEIQQKYKICPMYETIKEEGPDHNKVFHVNVRINKDIWGTGVGNNKKAAQQNAAQHALEKLEQYF